MSTAIKEFKHSFTVAVSIGCCISTAIGQVLPVSNLPSEIITSFPPPGSPPDPSNSQYESVNEQTNQTPVSFNNLTQPTRNIFIDGNTVIIDDSISGGLWERYDGAIDIAQLTINASNVIIRSYWPLPGANVTINCASLEFETNANDGIDNAAIDLTPLPAEGATNVSQNGINGQAAGNFSLNIAKCSSDVLTNRFIAVGGRGGNPGPGGNGLAGLSYPNVIPVLGAGEPNGAGGVPNDSAVWIVKAVASQDKENPVPVAFYGTQAWPTSGQNAVPAGKPGNPGLAGNVTTTIDVSQYSKLSGGTSGTQGTNYMGGAAGTPSPATWIQVNWNVDGGPYWGLYSGTGLVYTANGTGASSPPADVLVGTNGAQSLLSGTNSWVTAGYARAQLSYAKDLYRGEWYSLAQTALESLVSNLATVTNSPQASTLLTIQGEAQTLLHRLANGNAYWNWPVNFAPLLSVGITTSAFTSAIENSLYPVYLDQILHSANRSIADKLAAVQQSIPNLEADLVNQAATISNTLTTITLLQQEEVQNSNTIEQLQMDQQIIAQLDQQWAETLLQDTQLKQQAPFWQTALKLGSALLDFTPYGAATSALANGCSGIGLRSPKRYKRERSLDRFCDRHC